MSSSQRSDPTTAQRLNIDLETKTILVHENGACRTVDLYTPEGHALVSSLFTKTGWSQKSSYELTWLGIPIIQLPGDVLMMQELLHKVRPDIVVETGVAHGGSLVLYASLLELFGKGHVIGVDIEIRRYNRLAILSHPLSKRITLVEGSSTDPATLARIKSLIPANASVLITLDSNHTREHVAAELAAYAPLVTPGSYLVVFDGVMADLHDVPGGKPEWSIDNPTTAVREFLVGHPEFVVDPYYNRLGVTHVPGGFLQRRQ